MPAQACRWTRRASRSEEHTSELQSLAYLVCRLLLEKKKQVADFCDDDYGCDACCDERAAAARGTSGHRAGADWRDRGEDWGDHFFFFTDAATTEIYTLSLHDALPIFSRESSSPGRAPAEGSPTWTSLSFPST